MKTRASNPSPSKWLSAAEIAKLYNLPSTTVAALLGKDLDSPLFRTIIAGNEVRYRKTDVYDVLEGLLLTHGLGYLAGVAS